MRISNEQLAHIVVVIFLVAMSVGAMVETIYSEDHTVPAWFIGVASSSIGAVIKYVFDRKNGNEDDKS